MKKNIQLERKNSLMIKALRSRYFAATDDLGDEKSYELLK